MEPFWPFLIAFQRRRKLDEERARAAAQRKDTLPGWERLTERWRKTRGVEGRRRMRPAPKPLI